VNQKAISGGSFTVNALLNLTARDSIGSFDVRVNYSFPVSIGYAPATLDYSKNIFQGRPGIVFKWCANQTPINSTSNGCDSDDRYGQVHFSQGLLGQYITGPITAGLLFSVHFNVSGTGTSVLILDRANIFDPIDPDSTSNPHLLNVLRMAAVFSNKGIVSFFNYQPTLSQALLPGEGIRFDARGSFDADDTSIPVTNYLWDFGDGTVRQNVTGAILNHVFLSAGNYSTSLIVTNSLRQSGPPISWTVSIVKALGALTVALRTASGPPLVDPVTVKIFNSSGGVPFQQAASTSTVSFIGLTPGTYTLTFSGLSIQDYTTARTVQPGLTASATVYLTLITPGQSYVAEIVYGVLAAAVIVVGGAILLKRSRTRKQEKARRSALKRSART
jgi:hypothetical protein